MSKPQNANAQLYFDDLWHPGEARPAYHGNRTFAWKHQAVTSLQNHRIVDPNQSIRDRYKLTHTDPKPLSTEKATWLDLKSWLARELQDTREAVDMSIFMKIRPVHTLHTLAFLFCRYDRLCVLGVFAPELAWKRWFGHPQFVAGWKEGGYRAGPVWQST